MDLRILFPMLTMMYSGFLHTVSPAPLDEQNLAATTATPVRHIRTKRCSCATFLDKECVYFCHLDIIWVNTPERIVSYGLGNAPRRKRATGDPAVTKEVRRCKCALQDDSKCADFCQMENHRRCEAAPDKVILAAQGDDCAHRQYKHKLAAKTGRIRRVKDRSQTSVSSSALMATLKTRLLLENWRERQRHRVKAWEDEDAAS